MNKPLGHIKAASIMFEDNMKIDRIDYNKICLLTGKNGSGKTFVMKNVWCINVLAVYAIYNSIPLATKVILEDEAEFIYENTFDDCNFTGYAEGFFEGCELKVEFDKGKVIKVSHNFPEDLKPPSFPIYMSGQTRTFDTFVKYMKYKQALGIRDGMGTISTDDMKKLLAVYKLYDILFIEMQLIKLNGKVLSDELKKNLKEQYEIQAVFDQILVDTEECTIVNHDRDAKKSTSLTRYSAGEQSLLNMMLATT